MYEIVDTYTGRVVGKAAALAKAEAQRDKLGPIRYSVRLPLTASK